MLRQMQSTLDVLQDWARCHEVMYPAQIPSRPGRTRQRSRILHALSVAVCVLLAVGVGSLIYVAQRSPDTTPVRPRDAEYQQALDLATTLDTYNNGNLCN